METIFTLIIIVAVFYFIGQIMSRGERAIKASYDTATKGGTFAENFSNDFKIDVISDGDDYKISIKGMLPRFRGNTLLRVRAYDVYGEKNPPYSKEELTIVSSLAEELNDDEGAWFLPSALVSSELSGAVLQEYQLGFFVPAILLAKYSGRRTIKFRCSYLNDGGWFIIKDQNIVINMPNGWQEFIDNGKKTNKLFVNIGLAIVFADGAADKKESAILKDYATQLARGNEDTKKELNEVLKSSFTNFKNMNNSEREKTFLKYLKEFENIAEDSYKYKLADFAYAIMSADSVADENELKFLEKIKSTLAIDQEYFKKLSDRSVISLDASSVETNYEKLLNIDSSWPKDKKCSYITSEFQKWSNRLNNIDDQAKKDKAQNMLDLLAKARRKYEC